MNSLVQTLRNLGIARLVALAGVGIATLALLGFVVSRLSAPSMQLLYGDLDLRDSTQIVSKLDAMSVPYQLQAGGARILVPADQVAKLRMTMAEQSLPNGGSVGYEIFDKSEGFGTSAFQENINKLRALEGELARTIDTLDAVQSASVHLVLARRELFSNERQQPSASIVLKLRGLGRLDKGQVAAIQHLVAAAVPALDPNRVVIVDTEGTLLSREGGPGVDIADTDEEIRTAYESRLARNVEQMLARTLGRGKVRVEVHADMDFDRVTTNTQTYDPNGQVIRSTQSVTDTSAQGQSGGTPPVSVSTNLPTAKTTKPAPPTTGGDQSKTGHHEETTNYEISRTVTNQVHQGAVVRRLSVAVLVDGTYTTAAGGKRAYQPRSPQELKQLATLVRSAIGYDQKRGDSVDVVNLRFASPAMPASAAAGSYFGLTKDDLFRIGESAGLVLIAVLVILLVVRPLINRIFDTLPALVGPAAQPRLLPPREAAAAALPPPGGGGEHDGAHPVEEIDQMIDIGQVEGRVRASSVRKIGEIVEKHPEEAVSIMRSWIYQEG